MYKIIAIDADGTLLNKESRIPNENKEALLKAQNAGVHIALCSGRSIVTLKKFADELDLDPDRMHIISFNGAYIMDGRGKVILDLRMERAAAMYILGKTQRLNLTTLVYYEVGHGLVRLPAGGDRYWHDLYYGQARINISFTEDYEKSITGDIYKILLLGETDKLREAAAYMEKHRHGAEFDMFFSSPHLYEFTSPLSTKGQGLDFVCRKIGIEMNREAIAIGDSFNDLSMIKAATLGVCMRNGEKEVQAAADYITERDNHNCGVAEVVNKFIFKG